MTNNKMIEITQDLDSIGYDTGIEIKIIPSNFDHPNKFAKIKSSQLDTIMLDESSINKESLLMAFLYINSYIGCRTDNKCNPQEQPEAFWRSIEKMAKELAMSKDTITQCIERLTTSTKTHKALLIKKEVGSIQKDKNKPPQNVPNIYVLNKDGYEKEIEWALAKMLEVYGVSEFGKLLNGKVGK